MAVQLIWSPEAIEDLSSIADYIAKDSKFYAQSVVGKVISTAKNIPVAPQAGQVVPELEDCNIREKFVYSYRLIYQINEDRITILAIIHGKRLLENLIERF